MSQGGAGREKESLSKFQDREGLQELGRGQGPGGHESPKDNPPAVDGPVGDGDVGQEGAVGDKGEAAGCRTGGLGRRREGTVGEHCSENCQLHYTKRLDWRSSMIHPDILIYHHVGVASSSPSVARRLWVIVMIITAIPSAGSARVLRRLVEGKVPPLLPIPSRSSASPGIVEPPVII